MGQICELIQGTQEWRSFRLSHYPASEAAAMLGLSKRITREKYLENRYYGIEEEVSPFVQNLYKKGHEAEKSARAVIEKKIDDELYPAVYKLGDLMASVDGITIDEKTVFEHKLYNMRLYDKLSKGVLPDEYMPQCQQILLVTGAKLMLFVCSDGDEVYMSEMIIYPDTDWFTKIEDGWAKFKKDLANYGKSKVN